MANKITVSVVGGDPKVIDGVKNVREVKAKMGLTTHTATVCGEAASDDFQLDDYDFVALSPAVKAGWSRH